MNPGVSVKDGVIRYELLPDQHVKVEEGRWPFAGGELVLEPTLLDFSKPSDRIFTLRVEGLDAAQFIQQFDFRNFAVTGLFDGRSEEHTSELQSLMRISYAVFCLKKKKNNTEIKTTH